MKKYLISQKDLQTAIACCAVRQSPYDAPKHLELVLEFFGSNTQYAFKDEFLGFKEMTLEEVGELLDKHFFTESIVKEWNERSNGNYAPYGFTSRFEGKTDKDNDFIDLGALRRNILNQLKFDKALADAIENNTLNLADYD